MTTQLQLDQPSAGLYSIRSYQTGAIVVNEEVFTQSLIVLPDRLIRNWPPQSFQDLTQQHFDDIATLGPEIVILGTGRTLKFPSAALMEPLCKTQIGFEVMDTGAACRCYSALASEGRRVAAALLMIQG